MIPFPAVDLELAVSLATSIEWRSLAGKRVFLTGGTGFVGKWLLASLIEARRLHDFECEVVVLSRNPANFRLQSQYLTDAPGVRMLQGDVRDFELPTERFDVVVHAATDVAIGAPPLATFDTCVTGTRRVLDAAVRAGARDFLLVSSGAVYGRQPPALPAFPEDFVGAPATMDPRAGYGHGKRAAEWLCSAWGAEFGLRVVTARLFAFVGPGIALDGPFAVASFLRDAIADRPIVIQGDGTPLRSYLHAAEMTGWLWRLMFRGCPGQAYNVGGEDPVSIAELARRVASAAGSKSGVEVRGLAATGLASDRYVPDVGKAHRELGLRPGLTLDESLQRTVSWLRVAGTHL